MMIGPATYGWICPRCGKVWSPSTTTCGCVAPQWFYPSTVWINPYYGADTTTTQASTSGSAAGPETSKT